MRCFNILDNRVYIQISVTGELSSVINLWLDDNVIPYTKEVNVSYRMYFELLENFGLVLCGVH